MAPMMKTLLKNQEEMLKMLNVMSQRLDSEKEQRMDAEKELTEVKTQLTALSIQLADQTESLSKELASQKSCMVEQAEATPPTASAPPLPNLLIGTSLLRNVDPMKLTNWEIKAKGGASIEDLIQEVNSLPESKSYDQTVIVCGSIDLENKETNEIIGDFQTLIVSASTLSNKVSVASILPRTDKNLEEKTKITNDCLKKLCDDEGHNFIDNDPSFYLMNGSVNDACLVKDGLHLTKRGLDSLLKNCNVIKDQNGSCFTPNRYSSLPKPNTLLFKGHEHPLSNFFPVSISMNGRKFKSTEAAYQHTKAEHMKDFDAANKILAANTGVQAMFIATKVETNESWRKRKVAVMEALIKQKIAVCSKVRATLLNSKSMEIVENTDHEFWGRGKDGKGENQLGKIWMKFRKKLNQEPDFFSVPKRTSYTGPPSHRTGTRSHHTGPPSHRTGPTSNRTGPRSHYTGHTKSKSPQYQRWASSSYQPRCHNCGESGHVIRQCRQQELVSCWSCGQEGHKQKHCNYLSHQQREYSRYDYDGYDNYRYNY